MTQIKLQEDWIKEFNVEDRGLVTGSRKGTARLAGVSQQAIQQLLKTIQKGGTSKPLSEPLQPFAGKDFEGDKLPDLLMSAIVAHYAFKGVQEAQQVLLAMNAIGLRTYLQQKLGWQESIDPQVTRSEFEELKEIVLKSIATKPQQALPKASVDPVPGEITPMTERKCVLRLVRSYVFRINQNLPPEQHKTHKGTNDWMYRELNYREGYDIQARFDEAKYKTKIAQIEAEGFLPQLHAICNHFLGS